MSMPRISERVLLGLLGRLGQLHATGLAAAAGLDLRLDDHRRRSPRRRPWRQQRSRRSCRGSPATSCLAKSSFAWYSIRSTGQPLLFGVRRVAAHAAYPTRSADLRPDGPHPPRRVRGVKRAETQVSPRVSPPVTLAVTEYGDRSSSTHVLLVHGFPDDQQMWEPVVSALPEDWHVVTYDVRGAGRSTRPAGRAAYRTELLVEDLIAVARRDRPRRGAGAPRRARLGLDRRLGGHRRRDVGPPARGSVGVVHLEQRAVPGPSGQPRPRPGAAGCGCCRRCCTAGTSGCSCVPVLPELAWRWPPAVPPAAALLDPTDEPARPGDRRSARTPGTASTSTAPTSCSTCGTRSRGVRRCRCSSSSPPATPG